MQNTQDDTMANGFFCWLVAAGVALLAFVLLSTLGSTSLLGRIAVAGVIFLIMGLVLYSLFGKSAGPIEAQAPVSAPAPKPAAPAPKPAAKPAAAPASGNGHWTGGVAAASAEAKTAPAGGSGPSDIKKTSELPGEATLRDDVGSWKYEGEGAPAEKPETLTEAREGGADDLKKIKGVGPKLEGLLNSMGFFHFDQVAAWTEAEVAWVDENLEGFKGRVSRDSWVDQAKLLASGGETEFSKKVGDGGVY